MARYIDAKCRLCRREGEKLFLKGDRCFSPKCPLTRKGAQPPGQHGQKRVRKMSEYGLQLREKQKTKRIYGVGERQFRQYYRKALISKRATGIRLLQLLEMRLDNVLFRGGLVLSRSIARQMVNHNKILVDARKVNIPSFQLKAGQVLTLSPKALNSETVKKALAAKIPCPKWLERKAAVIKVNRLPQREEIQNDINEQEIVEFYSR